jgi:membrane-associated protease RseP (regulator of RpoE activity)
MAKFVCVRIVQAWGMDLQLFQFDKELTWAVIFMNSDRTIYGRYGTRSDHKDTARDISIEGFKKALQGALELHAGYPSNKKDLAGKTGPAVPWRTPDQIPELKAKAKPADGTRKGCIHCHEAQDGEVWSSRAGGQPITDRMLWLYPMPDALGFKLDPRERAQVRDVAAGSAADRGGIEIGDTILRMDGQPILSTADVQWVLQQAKEPGKIKVEIERAGKPATASLELAAGWRRAGDLTWRTVVWSMRHRLSGTEKLAPLGGAEKQRMGVAPGDMALRVEGMPPHFVRNRNASAASLQKGDVIVEVDGRRALLTESDYLAYLFMKRPGSTVTLGYMRGGKVQKLALTLP